MSQSVRKHSHFILDAKKQEQKAIKHNISNVITEIMSFLLNFMQKYN